MATQAAASADERIKTESITTRLMKRPELGAIGGVILVTIFFLFTASPSMFTLAGIMNFLTPAAQLGILGIAAAMLMIGGEFDLSAGVAVITAALTAAGVHVATVGDVVAPRKVTDAIHEGGQVALAL